MKPRLKELFRKGLMRAAESTGKMALVGNVVELYLMLRHCAGAWIVTGGMHAGVMKHVGEAVREFTVAQGPKSKIVSLGIAPWGTVDNKESLVSEVGKPITVSWNH